jgi:hypothetical protein
MIKTLTVRELDLAGKKFYIAVDHSPFFINFHQQLSAISITMS